VVTFNSLLDGNRELQGSIGGRPTLEQHRDIISIPLGQGENKRGQKLNQVSGEKCKVPGIGMANQKGGISPHGTRKKGFGFKTGVWGWVPRK